MASMWRQIISRTLSHSQPAPNSSFLPASFRFFSSSSPYVVKVGIPEFLNGIGKGVEAHVEKLETEFGSDLQKLLVARTLKLKKLEIPCKHRKLILKYAHKYRLGLWRPRADLVKV
uniref:Small ribosomal subunit protein mS41 SAM domain-containing protein n=1 Tax=Opuntia streptacantha TaxID=393608 RepID=A0A7C9B2B6_OPUST